MSQENVEIVRRGYEAYNRGDPEGTVADFAPTFEYVSTGAIPARGDVHRGPEGSLEFVRWLWDEFEDARIEVHELIEAGDRVLASVTLQGRGRQAALTSPGTSGTVVDRGRQGGSRASVQRQGAKPSKPPGCGSS